MKMPTRHATLATALFLLSFGIAGCSGSESDATDSNALLPAETPLEEQEEVIPEVTLPVTFATAVGERPAGAPETVGEIDKVEAWNSTVKIFLRGNRNLSGDFYAKYLWVQRPNGRSGQTCGTWRTAAEIAKTGLEPGSSYSVYIQYANDTYSPKILFTMPAVLTDTTLPTLAPHGFSYQSCSHTLYINGFDDTGIATVSFFNGDTPIGGDMGGMRECTFGANGECTAKYATHISVHGTIQVKAIAYDFAGNSFAVGPYPMTIP